MITSSDNDRLRTIRKLHERSWRDKLGLFLAEGEDLVDAAADAGWEPEFVLRAGRDVEPELLDQVSTLGSGTRVIGVYSRGVQHLPGPIFPFRGEPPRLSVYLHGVADPGNVGTIIRTTHALADGPVVLGPGCADPGSPTADRASMGSVFARPPARGGPPPGRRLALDPRAESSLADVEVAPPVVICLGAERDGLPPDLGDTRVRIPLAEEGPESLNVASAAAIALFQVANRMAGHA